jgi:hypothetical protein
LLSGLTGAHAIVGQLSCCGSYLIILAADSIITDIGDVHGNGLELLIESYQILLGATLVGQGSERAMWEVLHHDEWR